MKRAAFAVPGAARRHANLRCSTTPVYIFLGVRSQTNGTFSRSKYRPGVELATELWCSVEVNKKIPTNVLRNSVRFPTRKRSRRRNGGSRQSEPSFLFPAIFHSAINGSFQCIVCNNQRAYEPVLYASKWIEVVKIIRDSYERVLEPTLFSSRRSVCANDCLPTFKRRSRRKHFVLREHSNTKSITLVRPRAK